MVKYCVANECPINTWACENAAKTVISRCLKYLREEVKAPWDWETAYFAAENGHLHILEYLVERKYYEYTAYACECAASERPVRLFEVLGAKTVSAVELLGRIRAHKNNQTECVQYLLDNNCPFPEGWSYEDGELRTS